MNVIKFKDNQELTEYMIAHYFKELQAKEIIIPSGSTPELLYKRISTELDHSSINYYGLDEWVGVSRETIGSCHQMIYNDFAKLIPGKYNLLTFNGANTFEQECERLKPVIDNVQMDLAILGVGLNGHIGLNEHTDTTTAPIIQTELDPITKRVANEKYFTAQTQVENGITFSLDYLLRAKDVLVILNTPNKKDIWKTIQQSTDETIPAVYLKQFENVTYLVIEELYE